MSKKLYHLEKPGSVRAPSLTTVISATLRSGSSFQESLSSGGSSNSVVVQNPLLAALEADGVRVAA